MQFQTPFAGKPAPTSSCPHPPKAEIWAVKKEPSVVAPVLAASPIALDLDAIASSFKGSGNWKKRLPQLLAMLVALGRAREQDDGRFRAL